MSVKVFLDTNILVYCFSDEIQKCAVAQTLLRTQAGVMTNVHALGEFVSIATRKLKMDKEAAAECAHGFQKDIIVVPIGIETFTSALRVMNRYKLSYWDSLIVASALESGCEVLYSEDLQHSQLFDKKLKVVNPFLASKASRKH